MPITYYPTFKNSSGNVGIGNINPSYRLDIKAATTNGSAVFAIRNANDSNNIVFYDTGIVAAGSDFRAPIFYDSNDTNYYVDPNSVSRLSSLRIYSAFDTASSDVYANMRVMRNNATTDGMYIGYGNSGSTSALTRIFGGGATTGELSKYSNYTLEPGSFRSPIFYDSDNTAYYIDPASTSVLNAASFAGNSTFSTDSHLTFGPNSTWGSSIRIGGNGYTATGTETASVMTTDGNLHLDAAKSTNGIYMNWYGGTGGVYFGNGSSGQVGYISASGNASFSGSVTTTYGNFTTPALIMGDAQYGFYVVSGNVYYKSASGGVHYWRNIANSANTMSLDNSGTLNLAADVRAPIFYDSNNTAYYVDAASTSNLNNLTVAGTMTFGTLAYTVGSRRSKNSSNVNIETVSGLVSPSGPTFLEIRGFCPPTMYRTTGDRPAPYGLGFGNGSESGGIMPIGAGDNLQEIMLYGANSGPTTFTFKRQIWEGTAQDPDGSNYYGSSVFSINTGTGVVTASTDIRSPIYYDSDNTSYYINAAGTSVINVLSLSTLNNMNAATGVWHTSAEGKGRFYFESNGTTYVKTANNFTFRNNSDSGVFTIDSSGNIRTTTGGDNFASYSLHVGGTGFASSDFRAPIFYDSNNTAFYTDPASTSVLNRLTIDGGNYAFDWYQSISDFTNGTLVTTDIPATAANGLSFVMEVVGKSYNTTTSPFNFSVQGYLYNSTIINYSGLSLDSTGLTTIKIFENGGYLCFWWARVSYWNAFEVSVRSYDTAKTNYNRVTNITDAVEPTGTKKVTVTLQKFMRADVSATNSVDLKSPIFYDSDNTAYYIDAASTSNLVGLTVANTITGSVSGNAATATILQTARNINGTSFNGSAAITTATWGTARTLTIGSTGKSVDGSAGVSWSLAEIGALPLAGGTMTGAISTNISGTSIFIGNQNVSTSNALRINWHTDADLNYYIGKRGGVWTQPMDITFYTGIRYHAHKTYNAHIFYVTGYDSTEAFSIGKGDDHVRVNNNLYAPIFYDINDTTYYVDPASTSLLNATRSNIITAGTISSLSSVGSLAIYSASSPFISFHDGSTARTGYFQENGGRFYFGEVTYTESEGSFRAPLFYDTNNTAYYVDPASTSNLNSLTVVDGNLELYKSQTVDMSNTTTYSTSNYYPVTISVPVEGCIIQIQNNLNSNVPSWATHGSGFTLNLKWRTNGSGWGTTAVRRIIDQYHEGFANQTICGGITQMSNSSTEVVWLRGGGQYLFKFSRNLSATAQTTTYTVNSQSVTPTSTAQNTVWNSYSGVEIKYNNQTVSTDNMYTPVLYDWNNTSYYVDPASTSNLVGLTVANTITGSVSGNAGTATTLQTARNINGTSFNGSAAITTATWGTARTITIGSTGKSVDGSANVSWSLAELGAAATNQTMYVGTTALAINRSSASQTLTGISIDGNAATVTNGMYISGDQFLSGAKYFTSNKGSTSTVGANNTYSLEAYSGDAGAAGMSFHRGGYYAVNMGLDPDNIMRIGGWSASANRWELDMSGNNWVASSFRAPIFYDSNNTAYYIDAASASSLNTLTMAGSITGALDTTASFIGGVCTAASYNYVLGGANDGGNKLVIFVNGSSRSADGGVNALTIRNDGGPFVLGQASYLTSVLGSSVTINSNVALHAGNYGGYSSFSGYVYGISFYSSSDVNYYLQPTNQSNLWTVRANNFYSNQVSVTASASTTINTTYNVTQLTLSASITTLTFSSIQSSTITTMWTVVLLGQGSAYSITWPAAVKWPGGTAPTLTTTLNKRDIYQFFTYDGGTTIYAIIVGQNL